MALNPVAYTENVVRSFLRYQLSSRRIRSPIRGCTDRCGISCRSTRPAARRCSRVRTSAFRVSSATAAPSRNWSPKGYCIHTCGSASRRTSHNLRSHQEQAIRAIVAGRTTLISTGTGLGKTECFLYPIVSQCLKLRDQAERPGISAVIVYPMNALAEDQLMRLRGLLAGTDVPFGIYVGKTPEGEADVAASG